MRVGVSVSTSNRYSASSASPELVITPNRTLSPSGLAVQYWEGPGWTDSETAIVHALPGSLHSPATTPCSACSRMSSGPDGSQPMLPESAVQKMRDPSRETALCRLSRPPSKPAENEYPLAPT